MTARIIGATRPSRLQRRRRLRASRRASVAGKFAAAVPEKVSLFPGGVSREAARMLALLPKGAGTRDAFNYLLSGLAASDQDRFVTTSETFERARARRVIACAASLRS